MTKTGEMMPFPKHEFVCPLCGLPLDDKGYHADETGAWNLYNCEFNTTHWSEKPVRVRPTQEMMNESKFKRLLEQEAQLDIEFELLQEKRKEVKSKIKERISQG